MKKNNLFTLAACACALLLSACSNEIDTAGNPDRAGADEAIVTVSLQFPQADKPSGYAPGDLGDDVLPGVALDDEKEIKSIAFIAFTSGGTGVYLSENPTLTDNGFTKPLTPVDEAKPGEYTVAFKIKSGDFAGTTTIIAIANYKENGLTFGTDPSLDAVKKMLSVALAEEVDKDFIKYPLLMTASYADEITEGATVPITFAMERIMARVDVVNNAYDQTTKENNFVLTSARLISAPTQGMMIEGQPGVVPSGYIALKVQEDVEDILPADGQPVSPTNPAKQQLAPMYVYENSNTDKDDATKLSATATYVEVTGTYKGKAYKKTIAFKTPEKVEDGAKVGGEIVPIARNTRYVVEISSGTENKLMFDVKVTDWAKGDQLDVAIDFAEPVLEGLDDFTAPAGTTWDATTKTLNITHATAVSEFNLTVRGFQDSDFMFDAAYDANVNSLAKAITVERGLLLSYADGTADEEAPLSRTYKVTVPAYTGECPSLTKIIVYNAAYADAQTEITVKYAPFFMGDIRSDQSAADITPSTPINPSVTMVDLKNVPNGRSATVSFFASGNAELTTTIANKGLNDGFYIATTAEEADLATIKKFGPGKRVTLSYQALTDIPEWAEVDVVENGADAATAKKLFVKCLKKTYFASMKFSHNTANALVDGKELFLAVNDAVHGTIDYTVYDDANNTITLAPTADKDNQVAPTWIEDITKSSDEIAETYSDFQIVKRTVKVSLPDVIKGPAQAANFKVGVNTSAAATITLTPVYITGTNITADDKVFRPVLVKTVWWAPISIGQTKISTVGDPSTDCGHLFQWGRKRPFNWNPPLRTTGPLYPIEVETETKFVTSSMASNYDWLRVKNDRLWNSNTDDKNPVKTENDPCPDGWRIPSNEEGGSIAGTQVWAAGGASAASNGLLTVAGLSGNSLYFPAAGLLNISGIVADQGTQGYYWASKESAEYFSSYVSIKSTGASMEGYFQRAYGLPVRCVQEQR